MDLEYDLDEFFIGSSLDIGSSGITREIVMQYISAGILFPDEIRQAEQILRLLKNK